MKLNNRAAFAARSLILARINSLQREDQSEFVQSHFITALIGHLFNSVIVLVALFTFGWLASFALTYLHQIHPFPDDMLRFVLKLEMGLIYMDAAVSSLLLIVGAVRFLQKSREVNTMTKSEFREAFAEGFFGAMRLHYDLLRAPFVICAAFINDEPSPLRRVRNEEPRQFPPPSQTPATNN